MKHLGKNLQKLQQLQSLDFKSLGRLSVSLSNETAKIFSQYIPTLKNLTRLMIFISKLDEAKENVKFMLQNA